MLNIYLIFIDVVIEHAFILLGSLLSSVKLQLEGQVNSGILEENGVTVDLVLQLWLWTIKVCKI